MSSTPAPVIILGMHRSDTSLGWPSSGIGSWGGRYEDLLENPYRKPSALAAFGSLRASSGIVGQAGVSAQRALAYQHDPMLRELAERWRERLRPFGY